MKTKFQSPKTIEELEKLTYNSDKREKNRYQKWLLGDKDTQIHNMNYQEYAIKQVLSPVIKDIEKIPENNIDSLHDFISMYSKLLMEVKSVNTVITGSTDAFGNSPINLKTEGEWLEKINLTIHDIEKKEVKQGFFEMGVIYIDVVQFNLSIFTKLINSLEFIKKTNFMNSRLDGLLFFPENQKSFCYLKKDVLFDIFSKFPLEKLEVIKSYEN